MDLGGSLVDLGRVEDAAGCAPTVYIGWIFNGSWVDLGKSRVDLGWILGGYWWILGGS